MTKAKIKTFLLLYDVHYPVHSESAWAAVLDFIKHNKVDGVIFGGDALDLAEVAHHTKGKPIYRKQGALATNLAGFCHDILDPIDELLPDKKIERVWITGNHERFLEIDLIEDQPELDGMLNLDEALRLRERGYKIIGLGGHHKLGHLYVIHGDQVGGGANPAKKVVDTWCRNIVMGHAHTAQSFTKSSPSHDSERWTGTVLPCLSTTNPGYGRGRDNRWLNGFGIVDLRPDGNFNLYTAIITNGQFTYAGRTYGNPA